MNIIFHSITNDYQTYHRKREIESLLLKASETVDNPNFIYFNGPKFFLKATLDKLKGKTKQKYSIRGITIANLYIFLPFSIALKSEFLMWLFVTLPIRLQISFVKYKKRIGNNTINWFYKPHQYLYLKDNGPYIYLHYDNYKCDTSYSYGGNIHYDDTLKDCIKNSRMALISSSRLFKAYQSIDNPNVLYYPNAISRDLLQKPHVNSEIKKNKVIGFIGQLDNTFDFDLIVKIAQRFDEHKIVLIGPVKVKDIQLSKLNVSNIELFGYLEYNSLTKHIQNFDIGICPYQKNDFNQYRNPLKITEYFSYGIPVVTVKCDINMGMGDLVAIADDHGEFIDLIDSELKSITAKKSKARIEFAQNNCWDNRAEFIMNQLEHVNH